MTTKIKKYRFILICNVHSGHLSAYNLFTSFSFGRKVPHFFNIWIIAPILVHLILTDEQSVFVFFAHEPDCKKGLY